MGELVRLYQAKRQSYKAQFTDIYIALEELDFFWKHQQVEEFDQLWAEGWSIYYIADHFSRDPDEVLILYLDRIKKSCIRERRGGVMGWRG